MAIADMMNYSNSELESWKSFFVIFSFWFWIWFFKAEKTPKLDLYQSVSVVWSTLVWLTRVPNLRPTKQNKNLGLVETLNSNQQRRKKNIKIHG